MTPTAARSILHRSDRIFTVLYGQTRQIALRRNIP
jgi:hypothetical protein